MTAIWIVNRLFQALIWSPMIRLMFSFMERNKMRACVSLNSSISVEPWRPMASRSSHLDVWLEDSVFTGWCGSFCDLLVWLVGMGR